MSKLSEETINRVYEAAYAQGRADACREMIDTIKFLTNAACNALEDEIKTLEREKH